MSALITSELVALDTYLGTEPSTVIRCLAELLVGVGRAHEVEGLYGDAMARENKASTGIPGGLAIPHCRSTAVTELTMALARLASPVDFGAMGGPADLVFFIAAPVDADQEQLKLLAKLARSLMKKDFIASLRAAQSQLEIAELVTAAVSPAKETAGSKFDGDAEEERARDYARYAADFEALREEFRSAAAGPPSNQAKSTTKPPPTVAPTRPSPARTSPPRKRLRIHHGQSQAAPGAAGSAVLPKARGSKRHLLANLLIDSFIVLVWPLILIAPVAFVAQFGNGPQVFLGPFNDNVEKLVAPFQVATLVTLICAWAVNIYAFKMGSDHRALAGWELIPPACFVLGTLGLVAFAIVTGLIAMVGSAAHLNFLTWFSFPQRMPLSTLMIWTSGLTPAALLAASGFSSRRKGLAESDFAWNIVVPTTVVVFLISVLFS